jgi:hypothetical protein
LQHKNLLEICSLWIGEQVQCTWPTPNSLQLICNFVISKTLQHICKYIIVFCGKLLKNKFASISWFCLMCLVCLKGPKHGEKSWQNIGEKWKKEYSKILKLFCLGYLMSTILFCRVWFWNKKISITYEKKQAIENMHTQINK